MAYCKLFIKFAAVFNKLKLNIMKQKNLQSCLDDTLLRIIDSLDYILLINDNNKILSRTEESIINNWKRQINKIV